MFLRIGLYTTTFFSSFVRKKTFDGVWRVYAGSCGIKCGTDQVSGVAFLTPPRSANARQCCGGSSVFKSQIKSIKFSVSLHDSTTLCIQNSFVNMN